jgi:hypothetical protein
MTLRKTAPIPWKGLDVGSRKVRDPLSELEEEERAVA